MRASPPGAVRCSSRTRTPPCTPPRLGSRALGRTEAAQRHFRAAETSFRRVLAADEHYSLAALARLYADAGVRLDEAERLAEQHASFVRLPESEALLGRIRAQHQGR